MTWDLVDSRIDLHGYLSIRRFCSFTPDIDYWLNANNTYRVVASAAKQFSIWHTNFEVDAHNTGGIQGKGQFFSDSSRFGGSILHAKADGDGRPISLALFRAQHGAIRNFAIEAQPFWCNCIAEFQDVVYDGMFCNASNANPAFAGKNIVPNTDGINTYRSDDISLLNWDITCGDDCLAIKNSTNILARNINCRGGNGIAFGSLGQYANLSDIVENVHLDDVQVNHRLLFLAWGFTEDYQLLRLDPKIQPNMQNGVYFKSWDGSVIGAPPTGGGGATGKGFAKNITAKNVVLDRVNLPSTCIKPMGDIRACLDLPSPLMFGVLHFENWTGTALANKIVDIECSPAVGCSDISFSGFNVSGPAGQAPRYICQNVQDLSGLDGAHVVK
ncbi:pectin lyase fold/virulence factor [Mycena crocata]|nr:pectin lyase fold/virulence factor [Mycena crocata]